jgi:hypothetical protein
VDQKILNIEKTPKNGGGVLLVAPFLKTGEKIGPPKKRELCRFLVKLVTMFKKFLTTNQANN